MKIASVFLLIMTLGSSVQASPSASHVFDQNSVLRRLDNVQTMDFGRAIAKTPFANVLTEPVIRLLWATQVLSPSDWIGIQGLASIHHNIDPGGADGDASNMFVYTCKGGWIDFGHVINTALAHKVFLQAVRGTDLLTPFVNQYLHSADAKKFHHIANQFAMFKQHATDGKLTGDVHYWAGYFSMRAGYRIEDIQAHTKKTSSIRKFDSNATSAYTLEDLPSDYYGIMIAERLPRKSFVGGVVKAFKNEVAQMMRDFGAVDFRNKTGTENCASRAEEILKADAAYYAKLATTTYVNYSKRVSRDPKSPYNFTIVPKKTLRHSCVCNSSGKPINR